MIYGIILGLSFIAGALTGQFWWGAIIGLIIGFLVFLWKQYSIWAIEKWNSRQNSSVTSATSAAPASQTKTPKESKLWGKLCWAAVILIGVCIAWLTFRSPAQCLILHETDFEPSKGRQALVTLHFTDPGRYIIEASGQRTQNHFHTTDAHSIFNQVIRADGTRPDGTVWLAGPDLEHQGIPLVYPNLFPDKPYGAFILHINGQPIFAGTKHAFIANGKTDIDMDVNNFPTEINYGGEGTLHITVKKCG
ncbi:MAG: hypothetical protein A2878_03375 [Candidatus Moranbacteria bacterium RIFCSPHIGHO2_01_FULL_54_31]|nr:MAG: hypothetical protein A2878_03375 [Candidatus Moranbacteria bacterium RIFCSPHIGHO2_01_FULL_54_31]